MEPSDPLADEQLWSPEKRPKWEIKEFAHRHWKALSNYMRRSWRDMEHLPYLVEQCVRSLHSNLHRRMKHEDPQPEKRGKKHKNVGQLKIPNGDFRSTVRFSYSLSSAEQSPIRWIGAEGNNCLLFIFLFHFLLLDVVDSHCERSNPLSGSHLREGLPILTGSSAWNYWSSQWGLKVEVGIRNHFCLKLMESFQKLQWSFVLSGDRAIA